MGVDLDKMVIKRMNELEDRIYEIPPIPKEIIDAVNNDKLAIFIGAGVSQIIGCKGWNQLAQNLVDRCFSTKKEDGSRCINFKEKDMLSHNNDPKKLITICYGILEQNDRKNVFFDEFKKSLEPNPELIKSQNIYNELDGLHGLCITTNADQHFDSKFNPPQIVYNDFNPSNIDRTKLYHIHGSILNEDSLIFTVPQYIQRYNDRQFKEFLKTIFDRYIVLFLGYGMAEFELLDFLITKYDSNKGKELKHIILLPFYKGEENILKFERHYYRPMGIWVLGYEKDKIGYNQLYKIIKAWSSEINQTSTYLHDSFKELEEVIDNYGKE